MGEGAREGPRFIVRGEKAVNAVKNEGVTLLVSPAHAADACHYFHNTNKQFRANLYWSLCFRLSLLLSQRPLPDALVKPMRIPDEHARHVNHHYQIIQQSMRPVRRRCVRPPTACCTTCKADFGQDRPHKRRRRRHHYRGPPDFGHLGYLSPRKLMAIEHVHEHTTKYVLICSTTILCCLTSSPKAAENVARNAFVPEYVASIGEGTAPENEPTFRTRPRLLHDI